MVLIVTDTSATMLTSWNVCYESYFFEARNAGRCSWFEMSAFCVQRSHTTIHWPLQWTGHRSDCYRDAKSTLNESF